LFQLIERLDFFITLAFSEIIHAEFLDTFMVFVTRLADSGAIWIILGAILLCFKKTRKCGFIVLVSLLCAFLISEFTLKPIFGRARPFNALESIRLIIPPPSGSSFPSSHATTSFAAAIVLYRFNKTYGIYALIFAFFVAISRVYLCVHFFSDVLIGSLLGFAIGFIAFKIGKVKKR